jgi:PhnB protein
MKRKAKSRKPPARVKASTKAKAPAQSKAKKQVSYIPAGYSPVTPYLSIRRAAKAMEFYKRAFGAEEVMRMPGPGGRLGHAEISVAGARIMLSDEHPIMDFVGPETRGGTTVHMHVYVQDVDAMVERALAEGARLVRAVQDQFYGDRSGTVEDPFGHVWHFATHKEDLSEAEIMERAGRAAQQASG